MDLHHHVFDTFISLRLEAAGGYVEAGSAYSSSPPPSIPAFCALHGTDLVSPVQGGKMRRQWRVQRDRSNPWTQIRKKKNNNYTHDLASPLTSALSTVTAAMESRLVGKTLEWVINGADLDIGQHSVVLQILRMWLLLRQGNLPLGNILQCVGCLADDLSKWGAHRAHPFPSLVFLPGGQSLFFTSSTSLEEIQGEMSLTNDNHPMLISIQFI